MRFEAKARESALFMRLLRWVSSISSRSRPHLVMFDAASRLSVGILWLGFILITIMLYLKFDFIKLDDSYENLSFKEEWSDYFLAEKMLGYLPWSLFLGFDL